ncbi:MAG: hypothetical protein HFI17_17875, partial [Lachnospiraceae bacterium]|nr:hypothetical protein [Lachnospiraceae bacterium]
MIIFAYCHMQHFYAPPSAPFFPADTFLLRSLAFNSGKSTKELQQIEVPVPEAAHTGTMPRSIQLLPEVCFFCLFMTQSQRRLYHALSSFSGMRKRHSILLRYLAKEIKLIHRKSDVNLEWLTLRHLQSLFVCNDQII